MEMMTETDVRGIAGGGVQSLMDAGEFPQPVEYGPSGRRWRRDEVERWHADRVAAVAASRPRPQTRERHEPGVQTRPAE